MAGLNAIEGITCRTPTGAFYVLPNVRALPRLSKQLEEYFLEEWGVATLFGISFGIHGGGYLRLSYANSIEYISEALQRMAEGIGKL